MKNIIQIFKQYKWAVIAIIVVILTILGFFLYRWYKNKQQVEPGASGKSEFYLEKAEPPSGLRNSIDSFASVVLTFSMAVDVSTVKITTVPAIELKTAVYKENPQNLWLTPSEQAWKDNVEYKIVIDKALASVDGEKLSKPVEYFYYNVPPEVIYGGDY